MAVYNSKRAVIRLENVSKRYGKIKAVEKVSFCIKEGEIFGLLGPNGAGKTTLLRILSTLAFPDEGKAEILGFDIVRQADKIKKLIGLAPQEINLEMELTVYENLKIHGMLHKIKDIDSRINGLLKWIGLNTRAHSFVNDLSGGMKRRLLIARALMHYPKILFLDEPTIGLDPQIRKEIWNIIKELKKNKITILLTTHYIEEAEVLCDQVGIMNQGRLVALGTPWELKSKLKEKSLEDVFIKLTKIEV